MPDFWNNELTTSSVIVAQRIDPLPAPLTPQQQIERPYALGGIEIVPVNDLKMSKKVELQTFMIIYNPKTDSMNKPDVLVEYNFYAKAAGCGEVLQQNDAPEPERPDVAAAVRRPGRPPAPGGSGRSAGVVPGGRLPARDQGDRQDRQQVADAGRQLQRFGILEWFRIPWAAVVGPTRTDSESARRPMVASPARGLHDRAAVAAVGKLA